MQNSLQWLQLLLGLHMMPVLCLVISAARDSAQSGWKRCDVILFQMYGAGMSLVPLADIFNHKAAIVQLSDEYAIEPICFEGGDESSGSSDESGGNSGASGSEDETAGHCGDAHCEEPGCHRGGSASSLCLSLSSAAFIRGTHSLYSVPLRCSWVHLSVGFLVM